MRQQLVIISKLGKRHSVAKKKQKADKRKARKEAKDDMHDGEADQLQDAYEWPAASDDSPLPPPDSDDEMSS